MRIGIVFIILLLLASCTKKPQGTDDTLVENDTLVISYARPQMTLVGEAQQAALLWTDYQNFMTELENYDHSKPATNRLVELAGSMGNSIPTALTEQPVQSRIIVLRTTLGVYASAIRNKTMSKNERIKKYNEFVLATDQLHVQLNNKLNYDARIQQLIETLQGEFEQRADTLEPSATTITPVN